MTFRIYSSRKYLPPGEPHVIALFPFWGGAAPPGPPAYGSYADEMLAYGGEHLALVELRDADAAIFPQDWKLARRSPDGLERAADFVAAARIAGKPAVFFWAEDASSPFPFDEAVVFRPSLYRTRRRT